MSAVVEVCVSSCSLSEGGIAPYRRASVPKREMAVGRFLLANFDLTALGACLST